jgi:ubiquinone biosynthesis protein
LITLDGVGRSLGQDFDLYAMMEGDIEQIIKDSFSKEELIEEGLWAAKDILSVARVIPRHLKWFVKDFSRKKYGVELIVTGHEESARMINSSIIFLAYSIVACVFIASGVFLSGGSQNLAHWGSVPTVSWIFWFLGFSAFSVGFLKLQK